MPSRWLLLLRCPVYFYCDVKYAAQINESTGEQTSFLGMFVSTAFMQATTVPHSAQSDPSMRLPLYYSVIYKCNIDLTVLPAAVRGLNAREATCFVLKSKTWYQSTV